MYISCMYMSRNITYLISVYLDQTVRIKQPVLLGPTRLIFVQRNKKRKMAVGVHFLRISDFKRKFSGSCYKLWAKSAISCQASNESTPTLFCLRPCSIFVCQKTVSSLFILCSEIGLMPICLFCTNKAWTTRLIPDETWYEHSDTRSHVIF
jgi:hypothetical protein